ncbi:hypothetical protein BSU04_34790 [Caballeronia sordidicola]|uniref:Uncharacterized protein n=1 Tax=Caballeronia sordidicola TaxID=196367 RepID=A0A226WRW4_CABSO|nr:hypothetical protein BSU04_34790 [Caballeronia sordidicola]
MDKPTRRVPVALTRTRTRIRSLVARYSFKLDRSTRNSAMSSSPRLKARSCA